MPYTQKPSKSYQGNYLNKRRRASAAQQAEREKREGEPEKKEAARKTGGQKKGARATGPRGRAKERESSEPPKKYNSTRANSSREAQRSINLRKRPCTRAQAGGELLPAMRGTLIDTGRATIAGCCCCCCCTARPPGGTGRSSALESARQKLKTDYTRT